MLTSSVAFVPARWRPWWRRSWWTRTPPSRHLGVYAIAVAYFAFYSRHRLVASAPEEEFAALAAAEAELDRSGEG